MRRFRLLLLAVAAAAAAVAANVVLLQVASQPHDPVGLLRPRAALEAPAAERARPPLAPTRSRPGRSDGAAPEHRVADD